ncbi:hypothetical protein BBJ28_00013552 [Nothophytophthora sp. Chile5]|nr:hypothetical protein BBJ28_00013552 [Nothophytophthora sp. Chile5]
MLPISSLLENLPFDSVVVAAFGVGCLVVLPIALHLLVSSWRRSTDEGKQLGSDHTTAGGRKIHRLPSTLPLLENTWDVMHAGRGDMHHWNTHWGKHFNAEPVLIRSMGIPDTLFLYTPQAFEDIFKTQFENFPKGPFMCENLHDLLGDGIFAVDGDKWVHQRKTASNLFTMRALRESMTSTIQRHTVVLNGILGRASVNHETLDLFKLFNRFTIEAFAEIGFGVHMGCLDSEEEHPFQKAFDRAQRALLFRFIRPHWFWKAQRWLGVGIEGQLQRDIQVIDSTVLGIVEKALLHRSSADHKDGDVKGNDIVSLFLDSLSNSPQAIEQQFDPLYLRDVVVNFLIAGRDTTAQALSWFFLNLSQNPSVEAKIRNELFEHLLGLRSEEEVIPTMEQVNQLVYLEAALKETLRLHPSVPLNIKYVLQDTTLSDGTFVAAKSTVSLNTYAMARLPQVWGPDAEEFKPERWIDRATGKIINVSAYKFPSFNAGPRMCLGMNLAMLEMKLVVASLVSKFHIEVLNSEAVTYDLSLTLPVKGALNAKISHAGYPSYV